MSDNKYLMYLQIPILFFFLLFLGVKKVSACSSFTVTSGLYCWCDGTCERRTAQCIHDGGCLYHTDPSSVSVPGTIGGGTPSCENAWGTWFPDCGAGGGGGGCSFKSCTDCTLPTCAAANGGNPDYTTNKPVDAEGNTIASPLAACIGNSISCNGTDNCGDSCKPQGPYACY
ncbi:MAG TPA: hypothetical protein PK804_01940, partial [Candidatus Dojkabacteria bacterium]|nr:hypothetical protein [Candidatus Dojkabacteria bacterium]